MKRHTISDENFKAMAFSQKQMLFASLLLLASFFIRISIYGGISLLAMVSLIWGLVLFIHIIKKTNRDIDDLLKNDEYHGIPQTIVCELEKIKPNKLLEGKRIEYLVATTEYGINASTLSKKNHYYIVVTLGFIKQLLSKNTITTMILMHEYAHIYFDDLKMYQILERFMKKAKYLFVYLGLLLIGSLFVDASHTLSLLVGFLALFLIPLWTKQTHFGCEYRADYFSARHTSYKE